MIKKFRLLLINVAVPVSKFISKFHRPEMKVVSPQYLSAKDVIKDCDILVSKVDWELSNYFIPGKFKHAAVYFDGMVYESATTGVRALTLEEWLFKKDHVGITRVNFPITDDMETSGLDFLITQLGEPYDYSFSFSGSDHWYCSKYAYEFLLAMNHDFAKQFDLRETLGEPTVTPDDLWNAQKVFTRVLEIN